MDGNPIEESFADSNVEGVCSEAPRFLCLDVEDVGDLSRRRLSSNVLVRGLVCDSLLAWREWDRGVPGLDVDIPRAGIWGEEGLGDEYAEMGSGVPERIDMPPFGVGALTEGSE